MRATRPEVIRQIEEAAQLAADARAMRAQSIHTSADAREGVIVARERLSRAQDRHARMIAAAGE